MTKERLSVEFQEGRMIRERFLGGLHSFVFASSDSASVVSDIEAGLTIKERSSVRLCSPTLKRSDSRSVLSHIQEDLMIRERFLRGLHSFVFASSDSASVVSDIEAGLTIKERSSVRLCSPTLKRSDSRSVLSHIQEDLMIRERFLGGLYLFLRAQLFSRNETIDLGLVVLRRSRGPRIGYRENASFNYCFETRVKDVQGWYPRRYEDARMVFSRNWIKYSRNILLATSNEEGERTWHRHGITCTMIQFKYYQRKIGFTERVLVHVITSMMQGCNKRPVKKISRTWKKKKVRYSGCTIAQGTDNAQ